MSIAEHPTLGSHAVKPVPVVTYYVVLPHRRRDVMIEVAKIIELTARSSMDSAELHWSPPLGLNWAQQMALQEAGWAQASPSGKLLPTVALMSAVREWEWETR